MWSLLCIRRSPSMLSLRSFGVRKQKYRNARPVRAGFIKFRPVPPKTSLPITTPKMIPSAHCHKGKVGGSVNGNSIPVTRKPSLTSWPRMIVKTTSAIPPTAIVTNIERKEIQNAMKQAWNERADAQVAARLVVRDTDRWSRTVNRHPSGT